MNDALRTISSCRLCFNEELDLFVDFGAIPLGNNLQETVQEARTAPSYPLRLNRCIRCGHFQLGQAVAPELLYATNYTYLSGIGPSFIRHFAQYAEWAEARCELPDNALVVDVGSNDGTCLKNFRDRGYRVCGVDPASLAADLANEQGVETINAFFNADAVSEIIRRHGQADFVTSHNVLAHVDDLASTFSDIHALLRDGGYFAFEIGYFREVLRIGCFDTTYHEHLDYHHAAPLARHLTALGFDLVDLSVNSVQGGSLRLLLRKTGAGKVSEEAQAFLDDERGSVLYDPVYLASWKSTVERSTAALGAMVRARKKDGLVVGYGAPTKAVLLLKMAGLGEHDIAWVVDDNPLKVGRFLPGSAIAVRPTADIGTAKPSTVLILAWNFSDDILANLRASLAGHAEAIVPLPTLRQISL